jgi:cyclic pyranopterin phosphate synthase
MTRSSRLERALSHLERDPAAAMPSRSTGSRLRSRMVDVAAKPATQRSATARACLRFRAPIVSALLAGEGPKGPVTEVARTAGTLAAKRTADWIPMCHTLALSHVEIGFRARGARRIEVTCRTACVGPTGVEMEALVGAAVAALTVYDMTKALDHGTTIERLELVEKRGGKSGEWLRTDRRARPAKPTARRRPRKGAKAT